MKTTANKHPCDICQRPIGAGFLMCTQHWHLVPKPLQAEVNRTWGRVTRRKGTPHEQLGHIADYRKAREAAVSAVAGVITPTHHSITTRDDPCQ